MRLVFAFLNGILGFTLVVGWVILVLWFVVWVLEISDGWATILGVALCSAGYYLIPIVNPVFEWLDRVEKQLRDEKSNKP